MSRTSVLLMGSSNGKFEMVSDPQRGDGWYGNVDGNHTIAIYVNNFKGRIWIEASLASDPGKDDWFPIYLNGDVPYAQYPENKERPTGRSGDTGVYAYNFVANVVWIRARLDRSYMKTSCSLTDQEIAELGEVDKILLNS